MNEKKTIGELSLEAKKNNDKTDFIELQKEIEKGSKSEKSQLEHIWDCIDEGRSIYEGDFFVVVLISTERHLKNVVRFRYLARKSCPTPTFDQTVFLYYRKSDELEFKWSIPDQVHCTYLINALNDKTLHPDQETLAHICEAFINGSLDILCEKLNKGK